ncbi:MAG: SHOCT domain-containing protein [Candidatus Methylomirabilia bacterium]
MARRGGIVMMGWGWGGLGMGLGWVFMLLFLGLIIVAVALVLRWARDQGRQAPSGEAGTAALEILKQRYARGEIDREEFEAKKQDLVA